MRAARLLQQSPQRRFIGPRERFFPREPLCALRLVRVVRQRFGVLRDDQVAHVEVPMLRLIFPRGDDVHIDIERLV